MRAITVCLIAATLMAGCATTRPQPESRPSADMATAMPSGRSATEDDLSTFVGKVRAISTMARPARENFRTVERTSPALAEALASLSVFPTAENHRLAGHAYREAGIFDLAYEQYSRAVRLDPSDASSWDGMARIWRDWRLPHLALGDANRAAFHAPTSPEAHNTLGTILEALGQPRLARREFERALALDPQAVYALNNLCYSWLSDGNTSAAGEACRQAVSAAPRFAAARNNLALAYAASGDLERASEEFGAAGTEDAREFNLGIVFMAQRRFRAAAAAFDRAIALQPGLPMAAERARQARQRALAQPAMEENDGGGR